MHSLWYCIEVYICFEICCPATRLHVERHGKGGFRQHGVIRLHPVAPECQKWCHAMLYLVSAFAVLLLLNIPAAEAS